MIFEYPVELYQDEKGVYLAQAVDVPEAIGFGKTEENALDELESTLASTLAKIILKGEALPESTGPFEDLTICKLGVLKSMKLAILHGMQEQNLPFETLSHLLNVPREDTYSLLDPNEDTPLKILEDTLFALGIEYQIGFAFPNYGFG